MRKKILVTLLVLAALLAGAYFILKERAKTDLELNAKLTSLTDKIEKTFSYISKKSAKKQPKESGPLSKEKVTEEKAIVLHLKHGGMVSGKLLQRGLNSYTVEWKGSPVVISKDRITSVEYKSMKETEWPYKNNVIIKRTNGIIVDGEIVNVTDEDITLLFREGGGEMEMDIGREDVECLLFAPVYTERSREIRMRLKQHFTKMKFYQEGNITLVTDSHERTVNDYKKALRNAYTDIYLKFFKLFKGRRAKNQNFVVVFDDFGDYAEYALTDGVPFWAAVGYFNPPDDTLYLFNAFGERIEKIVFEIIVSKTGKTIDEVESAIKDRVSERHHLAIEGQLADFKKKFWKIYSMYKYELTERTFSTLRHEFAHEVFHNWGLQSVIVSRPTIDKEGIAQKKKEFLDTDDCKKKEELLKGLMRLQKRESEHLEMEAAGSWLAEGVATYCDTDPIGGLSKMWLFRYQEMVRKNEITPVEFLTFFKMGSFPGLAPEGMLNAYAQSWAFTNFLMTKYPDGFMEYQNRVADHTPADEDEELAWLLEALGKDLKTVEKEFRVYMDSYEKTENPYIKRLIRYRSVWQNI